MFDPGANFGPSALCNAPESEAKSQQSFRSGVRSVQQLDDFLASVEQRAFSMARVALSNDADALDIVQDAMIRLVEKYRDKPPKQWKPLFYRILQNRIMDYHRGNKVRRLFVSNTTEAEDGYATEYQQPDAASPANLLAAERLEQDLLRAISNLPLRQQQCFLLRAWEGFSVKETASAMGLNDGSVKTHYSRALDKLQSVLQEPGEDSHERS